MLVEDNAFTSREYPLKDAFHSTHLTHGPTVARLQVPRGTRYPRVYLIIKHLLLSILFLMVIWTLLKIPLADQYLRAKLPPNLPDSSVTLIKGSVLLARILVVILAFFGIFGVIKESFSLSLVFSVFMLIRLVATLYLPYFNNGTVSLLLIFLVTILSLVFLSLVRRTNSIDSTQSCASASERDADSFTI